MPGVTRKDVDASTGHDGFPPRPSTPNGSSDVVVNGHGVVRVTDEWPDHNYPNPPNSHTGIQATGSSTVFANGLAIARIGDEIDCETVSEDDFVAGGSSDVICG